MPQSPIMHSDCQGKKAQAAQSTDVAEYENISGEDKQGKLNGRVSSVSILQHCCTYNVVVRSEGWGTFARYRQWQQVGATRVEDRDPRSWMAGLVAQDGGRTRGGETCFGPGGASDLCRRLVDTKVLHGGQGRKERGNTSSSGADVCSASWHPLLQHPRERRGTSPSGRYALSRGRDS